MSFILISVIGIWQMKRKKPENLSESKIGYILHMILLLIVKQKLEEKRNKEVN